MSDFSKRGQQPGSHGFLSTQLFGHQIDGVYTPMLTIYFEDSRLNTEVSVINWGDDGDADYDPRTAKQKFFDFVNHPKVSSVLAARITENVGGLASIQLMNFIERENLSGAARPRQGHSPIETLRLIATSPNR